MNQGWTCPSCGRTYAPWMPECSACNAQTRQKTTPQPMSDHVHGCTCYDGSMTAPKPCPMHGWVVKS